MAEKRYTRTVVLRLTPEMHEALTKAAEANDRTVTQEIRRAVRSSLCPEAEQ